eukprot:Skav214436  [mRNA]  locus=scaffold586:478561:478767:+ [translate_table: standard]
MARSPPGAWTWRLALLGDQGIRRIYFSDRLYSEEELPPEFKLFLPVTRQLGPGPRSKGKLQGRPALRS